MKKYIKTLRIKHYLKNILILLPLVYGRELFNADMWLKIIPGFFAFSFVSSALYILNDIKDRDMDRLHPIKCKRPIASGEIKISVAIALAICLFTAALVCNALTFNGWESYAALAVYAALNVGYSLGLKNVPILDIFILVSGFFIRVMYGSFITGITISNWMYLTVMMMSFYLGLGKRRNELIKIKDGNTRGVLKFYNKEFLDKFMYLCLAVTVIFYSLWCVDEATIAVVSDKLIWTIPFVIALCMRYSLDIEGDSYGDPVDVISKDKILLIGGVIFILICAVLIYK